MIWRPNRPAFCHLLCLELKVRFGDGGKKIWRSGREVAEKIREPQTGIFEKVKAFQKV